jgi:hypothetical protein
MKKMLLAVLLLITLTVMPAGTAQATTGSTYPWNNHAAPYTFLFGNHIDSHQQSLLTFRGKLVGYLYIHFTGEIINGIPVAEHMDCPTNPSACVAGWVIQGVPAKATVVGVDMANMSMSQFCVSSATKRILLGYSHFHWLGDPFDDMGLSIGQTYSGYLLKLTARRTFYFRHHPGDMPVLVTPGIDTSTHANVTTCP